MHVKPELAEPVTAPAARRTRVPAHAGPFCATLSAVVLLLSVVGATYSGENWSQFRGPGGSGVAEGQKPPVEFGPNKNLKWKVAAPSGLSSPIVVADKLVLTAFDDGKLYTIAYERATGPASASTSRWKAGRRDTRNKSATARRTAANAPGSSATTPLAYGSAVGAARRGSGSGLGSDTG